MPYMHPRLMIPASNSTLMNVAGTKQHRIVEPEESTRLLHDEERNNGPRSSRTRNPTPLPKAQFAALIFVRIVDLIAYMQIFPYINQFLADLRIAAPEQVGFYSGFIESTYSVAEMLSVYQWGKLSDNIGRRPAVIITLVGIAVTTTTFGLSTSLVTLLASRFLCGLAGGNLPVLHSIVLEITDDTNQHIAIPIYSLSWPFGAIVGSFIGGTFANAATQYPTYFGWPIFLKYPYLPPCIVGTLCALLGIGLSYAFIKETLPNRGKSVTNAVPDGAPSSTSGINASVTALLAIPGIRALTLSGIATSFLASAFDVVFALFCYAPVDAGGLGLQPSTIGNFLAFAGSFALLLRLVVLPYILLRFDYATTFITCTWLWPFAFISLPLLNALALSNSPRMEAVEVVIWIGLALVQVVAKLAAISFTLTMLLTKRHAPTSSFAPAAPGAVSTSTPATKQPGTGSMLGQCNGLIQFSMSLGRAIAPVVVSTVFTALNGSTWARRWGLGWTWSVIMVCLCIVSVRITRNVG